MALTVGDVRDACALQLAGLAAVGLPAFGGYPGQLTSNCVVVRRVRGPIVTEFNGDRTTWLAVTVYARWIDNGAAQDVVDAALSETGATSIVAAVQADTTWGGAVRHVLLEEPPEEEGLVEVSGVQYLSGSVPITVVHP